LKEVCGRTLEGENQPHFEARFASFLVEEPSEVRLSTSVVKVANGTPQIPLPGKILDDQHRENSA
jgi:hypothetical protein